MTAETMAATCVVRQISRKTGREGKLYGACIKLLTFIANCGVSG